MMKISYVLIFFYFAFMKTMKVCMLKSCLDCFFHIQFFLQIFDIISTIWSSIIPRVKCYIIASGINVIFFLSENTTAQTGVCVCVYTLVSLFHKYGFSV